MNGRRVAVSTEVRPRRGTRPANRRELILAAATRLFAERGYEHVSVGDIAAEVEVGPSALYRHFKGKEQILVEVIGLVVDDFTTLLRSGADPREVLVSSAGFVLDHRAIGLLWEREARHLPPAAYAGALERIREVRTAFAQAVGPADGGEGGDGTNASAAMSVVMSPSFHHTHLPRPAYEAHITDLAERVLATPLPRVDRRAESPRGLRRSSTREGLVAAAVELFAERTYATVSIEDVATSVGMAASSLYNHLPSKNELLLTALTRADGFLQLTLDQALARSADAESALGALVETYTSFALESPALIDVLVTEVRNLPDGPATTLHQEQRAYVDEWSHLVQELHPGLDAPTARVTVHATLMMINDLARSPGARSRADAEEALTALARSALGI